MRGNMRSVLPFEPGWQRADGTLKRATLLPGQCGTTLLQHASTPARLGRIAQLVEQLTLNQRVQGSSPCAPTIDLETLFSVLLQNKPEQLGPVGRSVGSFCSLFELRNRAFGKCRVSVKIVRIEDRTDIAQAMTGNGSDFGLCASGDRQSGHGRSA